MDELLEYRDRMLARWQELPREFLDLCNEPGTPRQHDAHMAHLLVTEERIFAANIRRILDEESPNMPSVELHSCDETSNTIQDLAEKYAKLRVREAEWIVQMPGDGWSRGGRHPFYGMRTLQWWVEQSLVHGLNCLDVIKNG